MLKMDQAGRKKGRRSVTLPAGRSSARRKIIGACGALFKYKTRLNTGLYFARLAGLKYQS
jgi:hypothetical protein